MTPTGHRLSWLAASNQVTCSLSRVIAFMFVGLDTLPGLSDLYELIDSLRDLAPA